MKQDDLNALGNVNGAGFTLCAGYLSCIFHQSQLGRPLNEEETAMCFKEAIQLFNAYIQQKDAPGEYRAILSSLEKFFRNVQE